MKKFFAFLLFLILILGVVGYFLPTHYTIKKSTTISSYPAHIHKYVGDLSKWPEWTPWKGEDPEIEIKISEKTTGIGASQSWKDKHGGGSLVFTSWSPEKGIEYDLFFQSGKYKCKSAIQYDSKSQSKTRVNWTFQGDTNIPIVGGYMALFMKYSIGSMFQQGLNQLKVMVEQNQSEQTTSEK